MKPILFAFLTLLSIHCLADGPIITGNASPVSGSTETYTSNWEYWDNTFENYAVVTWEVTGGTILSKDKHTVTIQWNTTQNYLDARGNIYVMEDLTGNQTWFDVAILDNTPGTSQTCGGILGPAKIVVNFGAGSNPGTALTAGTTTYDYEPFCAIDVNQYTIINAVNACRPGWTTVAHDHTGNTNGYMMMVNGNNTRGEFYRTTITGLNSDFDYEFSAWVGNLFDNTSGANPALRFQVYDLSGNELMSSGSIDVPVTIPFAWQKIGYMVAIPPGVTAVTVVLSDVQTAGFGNDIVLDDISFAQCFPPVITSFSPTSQVTTAHTCLNGTVNLYASWPNNVDPFTNPSYQWQRNVSGTNVWTDIPGATALNFTLTEPSPGIFWYRMHAWETANPSQELYSNGIVYYVQQMVVNANTTNAYACAGNVSQFMSSSYYLNYSDGGGTYTFTWSPDTYLTPNGSGGATFNMSVAPPADGGPAVPPVNYTYTLTVTNNLYGCTASNTQTVIVHNPRKVYVPNAFTPNGDGNNDLFRPINIEDYPGSSFSVYDRWGTLVFYSTGPTQANYSWNGTYNGVAQPVDTYVWQVQMTGCPTQINGSTNGPGVPNGTVILIR